MPITGLSNKERPPYVMFVRGTPSAYDNLRKKDANTLYYIAEKDAYTGSLYLGDVLLCAGGSVPVRIGSLKDLKDVEISEDLSENSLLIYDGTKWINESVEDVIGLMIDIFVGASQEEDGHSGLVPAPLAGQEDFFLKGDGTWAKIDALISKLEHTLTIGDKTFDGSEDISIEV